MGKAAEHYARRGWVQVETPWMVSPLVTQSTTNRTAYATSAGHLIGSAEQGFLELLSKGWTLPEKSFSISPCFRKEPELSPVRSRSFIKLELFSENKELFRSMMADVWQFATYHASKELTWERISDRQYDLVTKTSGVELGSFMFHSSYICGTGLALPRFHVAQ